MPDGYAAQSTVAREALAGLGQSVKTLPAKLFYDEEGCRLFGAITQLPEYYPTRTESALLRSLAPELRFPDPVTLVEYGASDEAKAALLFPHLTLASYVPIDIAGPALSQMAARLATSYPGLPVHPVEGDFLQDVALPAFSGAVLGFFPGSTIGNLHPDAARHFLRRAGKALGPGARFLIGADLRKDPAVLVPAYDDSQGVTAAFNLNLLTRLNREASADFDLATFAHRAIWNEAAGRIEMHLVSLVDQFVPVAGSHFAFQAGETIHTENSYKHTLDGFRALAAESGWTPERVWTDPAGLFSVHMLVMDSRS